MGYNSASNAGRRDCPLVGTGLKVRKAGNNWWLRSPGNNGSMAAFVNSDGNVND